MRYFRLIRDTPEADAGTIFKETPRSYGGERVYEAEGSYYTVNVTEEVLEEETDWYEEVTTIYVKPKNVARLEQIDDMTDQHSILTPYVVQGGAVNVPAVPNMQTVPWSVTHTGNSSDHFERDRR